MSQRLRTGVWLSVLLPIIESTIQSTEYHNAHRRLDVGVDSTSTLRHISRYPSSGSSVILSLTFTNLKIFTDAPSSIISGCVDSPCNSSFTSPTTALLQINSRKFRYCSKDDNRMQQRTRSVRHLEPHEPEDLSLEACTWYDQVFSDWEHSNKC